MIVLAVSAARLGANMSVLKVFISHNHRDALYCQELAQALRARGAEVWYDEDSMGRGTLTDEIQQRIRECAVFLVVLSKAAFESIWVRRECFWAYECVQHDSSHSIVPITIEQIDETDFFDRNPNWIFLHDYPRVEIPGGKPYSRDQAIQLVLRRLSLSATGSASEGISGSDAIILIEDEIVRGKALIAQGRLVEALNVFTSIANLRPTNFDAWANQGIVHARLKQYGKAIEAYDHALALKPDSAVTFVDKGNALEAMSRPTAAMAAYAQAYDLDPSFVDTWSDRVDPLKRIAELAASLSRPSPSDSMSDAGAPESGGAAGSRDSASRYGHADVILSALRDDAHGPESGRLAAPEAPQRITSPLTILILEDTTPHYTIVRNLFDRAVKGMEPLPDVRRVWTPEEAQIMVDEVNGRNGTVILSADLQIIQIGDRGNKSWAGPMIKQLWQRPADRLRIIVYSALTRDLQKLPLRPHSHVVNKNDSGPSDPFGPLREAIEDALTA